MNTVAVRISSSSDHHFTMNSCMSFKFPKFLHFPICKMRIINNIYFIGWDEVIEINYGKSLVKYLAHSKCSIDSVIINGDTA